MRCLLQADIAFLFYTEFFKILFFFRNPFIDKAGKHICAVAFQNSVLLSLCIKIQKYFLYSGRSKLSSAAENIRA